TTPRLARFPYGAATPEQVAAVRAQGQQVIAWSVDPRDWQLQDPKAVIDRVLAAVQPGAIVLLHSGGGDRQATVQALPDLLRALRRQGYQPLTVSQLLHRQ